MHGIQDSRRFSSVESFTRVVGACSAAFAARMNALGVFMRLFNLFLRRAGVQPAPIRNPSRVSRLTVVCPQHVMADVRKQIYLDFEAAGLSVAAMSVDGAQQQGLARACVTVNCPPELRPVLMSQARQLSAFPGVHQVQWGDRRHIALN
jgi:hypothetical protein